MNKINDTKSFYEVVEKDELTLVYFYTKWCPDCFMVKPFLPRLEEDFKQVSFYKMDRDTDIELARHLHIYGIPSFLIFKGGEEIGSFVSKNRKTYLEVYNFIKSTIGSD